MKFRYEPESKPLDGYTIKRAIQRGGFGEVYYALSDAGKEVALKLLHGDSELSDVELRGVSECLNLKHQNLMAIFDVRENSAGEFWIVMEYVHGRTLDEVVAEYPNGTPQDYVETLLTQIAAGADYLHDRGVVHRDLKPANIYLENGVVKIGDVGLAKFMSESARSAHTQSVGTVYYMAPEIAHGRYGREVDVYATAVMLFELLTGKVPFDGESTGEILMKQLSESPDLSRLPAAFRPVLQRGLAKDPLQRTPSVGQLAAEFSAARSGRLVPGPPPVPVNDQVRNKEGADIEFAGQQRPMHGRKSDPHARTQQHVRLNDQSVGQSDRYAPAPWHTNPWNIAIVIGGVFALMLFSPLVFPVALMASPLILLVGFGFLAVFIIRKIIETFQSNSQGPEGYERSRSGRAVRLNERYVRHMSVESSRHLSGLERAGEATGSMAVATLCAGLIAVGLGAAGDILNSQAEITLFGVVTALGAWAAILPGKLWEGRGHNGVSRRLATGLLGMLTGVGAWFTASTLQIDLPLHHYGDFGARLSAVLPASLSYTDATTLIGYGVFFSVLMTIRRWWSHVDSYRNTRLQIGSVLVTGIAAWLLSMLAHFPTEWGVLWAVAISTSAQLASVWVHPEDRLPAQSHGRV
jgi:eukaryotic-like serine/threonine-protein kinase